MIFEFELFIRQLQYLSRSSDNTIYCPFFENHGDDQNDNAKPRWFKVIWFLFSSITCHENTIFDNEFVVNIWTSLFQILNQGGGKTIIIFKVVNLDSSIRIQTLHNGYLYDSPDQGLQSLGLGFLI